MGDDAAPAAAAAGPTTAGEPKDPRTIARKYQLDLCKRAVEENIIVYLGTGCGKTHIAVLLIYELGHLIRKPSREVCIFLAPTIPLVRQQAMVIASSTDFKVQHYYGNGKSSRDHQEWENDMRKYEVLVMTPQILLHSLRHCFIKMNSIALLIFDECHHAQAQKRHPYAQIMKEFYNSNSVERLPRVFGMTASPIIGKGGSNKLNYTKCINSLEELLHAKVCSVDNEELESVVASPAMEVYFYGPVNHSNLTVAYSKELDSLKLQSERMLRDSLCDFKDSQKKLKSLWRLHENLIFSLQELGSFGALQAARTLLSFDGDKLDKREVDLNGNSSSFAHYYLSGATSILSRSITDGSHAGSFDIETFEEPFFSDKFSVLINVLSRYRLQENMKCIVFVKRITVARAISNILQSLKCLDFWKCEFLVGCHSGLKNMSRNKMDAIVERFSSGEVNLLVATSVGEEGLDIQTCCLVVRFDLPETVASFIQSRGRARMTKSKYVVLLERGNQSHEKLLNGYIDGECIMNEEIDSRTSNDIFDCLAENIYRVDSTGASISTACSVSLLHRYCDNLPRDMFFTPSPAFFYIDGIDGIICRLILPPNASFRQVDGQPCLSKDEAKRDACLKACIKLHKLGALTDFLLPGPGSRKNKVSTTNNSSNNKVEDESLREELHQMLIPAVLKPSRLKLDCLLSLHFYYVKFIPIPEDRRYQMFGLFVINPLPVEAETLQVDLHLARGRIVKAGIKHLGKIAFEKEKMMLAQKFQEMFLKILLDRSEFTSSHVILGNDVTLEINSTFYLLLPIKQKCYGDKFMIDWPAVERCLSSPIFKAPKDVSVHDSYSPNKSLRLLDGICSKTDVVGSVVFSPHNNIFFFVDAILDEINARSEYKDATYAEHFKERFGIELSQPEQPLLKAKQLFNLRNLLHNRLQETTESEGRELTEHFVELPPELCSLKVIGFSKDMGSSLSLLPSLMYRLENLLVAIELKDVMSSSFPEASKISASGILEAITTEKCLERISLERFEVLGDAFLKYVVGRHNFITYEGLDEGQLTRRRSDVVNNSNLYDLSIRRNLQVYIRDQQFEPIQFFAPGRPCKVVCNSDVEVSLHQMNIHPDNRENCNMRCTKSHHWLHRKVIADVVESLIGVFLVEGGFKAAFAFMHWMGIDADFNSSALYRVLDASSINLSLLDYTDIAELEELIDYKFKHKGLLLQAFVHPSFSQHSGGCYQRLEFLGDAVLEYVITSYLYSTYPNLKPGQITDLRSLAVGNDSLAYASVQKSIHRHLIKDSNHLTSAISRFEKYVKLSNSEKDLLEEPACPKVLGDIVESCIGAVLLDSGFNLNNVWRVMLMLLKPVLTFSNMHTNPMRELRELCQCNGFELGLPKPVKADGEFHVRVEVNIKSKVIICTAANRNSKAARKFAAQETLSKLKSYGYKHRNKSLEEILVVARKRESELIGYNEDPIDVESDISVKIKSLHIHEERDANISFENTETSCTGSSKILSQRRAGHIRPDNYDVDNGRNNQPKLAMQSGCLPSEATETSNKKVYHGDMVHKTARSFLFELCAANYWKPPEFKLCKEEGPSHLPKFTYKVVVEIKGTSATLLECHSDAKHQKKAAQEHAAQGAVWCLKQLGHLPKEGVRV
ncbi:endoribonuclease Dicer homolog 4 [Oryza brachyantha]|uniref:Dicer-like protein 4 n=1 Tax=Oryza brachyantha TaxID=4533 RepID=J3LZG8_ORYBR|nr:endoribonuclease Dicer homolog 4 [Oryza brachyantha]